MSNTSYPQQHFTASALTLCNNNSTHLPRDDLHKWFTAKLGFNHTAPNQRQIFFSPVIWFLRWNRFMSISENMQGILSVLKHETQLLTFFTCMYAQVLHITPFWCQIWHRFLLHHLHSDFASPVECTQVPMRFFSCAHSFSCSLTLSQSFYTYL